MQRLRFALLGAILLVVTGCPSFPIPVDDAALRAAVLRWNTIAVDTSGLDHSRPAAGDSRTFGHQLGPGKSSRAAAITHIAIFDSVNAIVGGFESYTRIGSDPSANAPAAIAQAAHDTLVALYPSHATRLAGLLAESLDEIPDAAAKTAGIALGAEAAAAILALRENDGSELPDVYEFSDQPGKWRTDPLNPNQPALGASWFRVKPFVINSATQFRVPPPPAMDSAEYAAAYNEVKRLGGDGVITATERSDDQTVVGIYWAYDGTPSLCAPPRLYNQIATKLADDQSVNGVDLARLLALVNVSMADAGIAIWESKYFYNVWRPVTGIREADAGTGATGLGDGNSATEGDANFVPLCAPASNLTAPNFTPPFPAYPSGHAGFGGAIFQTMREFFGTDDIEFTFVSDEYNGVTLDNAGNARPLIPRSFNNFSEAEEENGQSRIYLGIHWAFDKTEGITQGRKIATHVFDNAFQPVE